MLIFIKWLVIGIALLGSIEANAQSFSCKNAAKLKPAEQTICENIDLSFLDRKLNYFFQRAITVSPTPQQIKTDQLNWLKNIRNPCATNIQCLSKAYQTRIINLSKQILTDLAKKNPKPFPVRFDHSIDAHPDGIDPFINSQNACVNMFLKQSIPSYESNVADYHFTKDSLDELPVNLDIYGPHSSGKNIAMAILKGQSGKQFYPEARIIYLIPHEIRFIAGEGKNVSEIRLKILAWGDFNHDGLEDVLLYKEDRFSLNKKMTEWSKWDNFFGPQYIILTKKKNEKIFRTLNFYYYTFPDKGYKTLDNGGKVCIPQTDNDFSLKSLANAFIKIPTIFLNFTN